MYSHSPGFCLPFTYDLDDRLIGAGVNDLRLKVQIGVHGTMAGGGLGAGDNHSDRDHFIELQPLFAGVHPGDRPAEDEAALAGGSGQRFTLGNSLFQLFVGVVKNILQRLLPTWVVGFGTG